MKALRLCEHVYDRVVRSLLAGTSNPRFDPLLGRHVKISAFGTAGLHTLFLVFFFISFYDFFVHLLHEKLVHSSLSTETFLSCILHFLRGMNSYLLFCGWSLNLTHLCIHFVGTFASHGCWTVMLGC